MPAIARLPWLWHRLGAMSGPELLHRAAEQGRRLASRYWLPDFAAMAARAEALPVLPGLHDDLARCPGLDDLLPAWRSLAGAVAENRFAYLGRAWPGHAGLPDWHLDPVSGRRWPRQSYCFAVPYRHADGLGDVKYAWELNRLQYLQPLAALAALGGETAPRELVIRHLESWIAANPPYRGVAWASGIELALRVVSLLVVCSLLGPALPRALREALLRCLAAHGYWLARFPSRFSSANNHRVAEAGALFLLGRLAPALAPAGDWGDAGRRALATEALRQFHGDGVGAEQAPSYGAFSLEWFLLCGVVAGRLGEPFDDAWWARLDAAGDFLRALTDAGGNQPRIGDDDEGRVIADGFAEPGYVSGVLAALAAVRRQPALAPPGPVPHLRWALSGAPPAPVPPASGLRHFPDGGYTVLRHGAGGDERLLVMDHGPLGHLSISAHGHADALAIWLHLGGRPVLVDAGTYLYHAGGGWRDHFRGTPAHNTLALAGADSSTIAGPFNWTRHARCRLRGLADDAGAWAVEAEHDGYLRRFGVRHCRRLSALPGGGFEVADSLLGAAPALPVEIGFQFAPDLTLEPTTAGWLVRDGARPLLSVAHAGPLEARVQCGAAAPRRAWVSPGFGRKLPAPRLTLTGALSPGQPAVTAFQPFPA